VKVESVLADEQIT